HGADPDGILCAHPRRAEPMGPGGASCFEFVEYSFALCADGGNSECAESVEFPGSDIGACPGAHTCNALRASQLVDFRSCSGACRTARCTPHGACTDGRLSGARA
ncbi:MAG: hypothetical protein PHW61_06825, partial [Eubacteriales bacterium]|nr:hypothetical protein [Eubacteriales bacterium]